MIFRTALAALLGCALCGCVAFEQMPTAALGCDPALAGRWVPDGLGTSDAVEIDARCRAKIPGASRSNAGPILLQLRGFESDGQRYLAFDKTDIERMMGLGIGGLEGSDLQTLGKAFFLLRYRIDGDTLQAAMADQPFVSDAIEENLIPGKALGDSLSLVQAGAGDMPALLRSHDGLFVSEGRGWAAFKRSVPGRKP